MEGGSSRPVPREGLRPALGLDALCVRDESFVNEDGFPGALLASASPQPGGSYPLAWLTRRRVRRGSPAPRFLQVAWHVGATPGVFPRVAPSDCTSSPVLQASGTFAIDRRITCHLAGSQGHPRIGFDGMAASCPRPALGPRKGRRESGKGAKKPKINDQMGPSCFLIKKRTLHSRVAGKRAVNRGGDLIASPAAFEMRDLLTDGRASAVLRAGDGRGRAP